jgi:hypothetical protein
VGQLSHGSDADGANDWTDLERGFFEAAPPEVAIQPPPPASFEDLSPIVPARARRQAAARKTDSAPGRRRDVGSAVAAASMRVWASLRVAASLCVAASRRLAALLRVTPGLRATRARLQRSLRALLARSAADLPKRPDGKTIVVAMAAMVVVSGLSARVLGSRGYARSPSTVTATTIPVETPPAPSATEAALVPALGREVGAARAPEQAPAPKAAVARAAVPRHRAKRHAARAIGAPLHAHASTGAR